MHPFQGRGSPELDIFEVMAGASGPAGVIDRAFMSSSLHVAPGIPASNRALDNWYQVLLSENMSLLF